MSHMLLKCGICLSCEILFSQLPGNLGGVLNIVSLVLSEFDYLRTVSSCLPLSVLLKLLFCAVKAKDYKSLEWRTQLHGYLLLKNFYHREMETLLLRYIT